MLRAIDVRVHNIFAREASLHGVKLPMRGSTISKDVPDNKMDEKLAEEAMLKAQERIKARYGRK